MTRPRPLRDLAVWLYGFLMGLVVGFVLAAPAKADYPPSLGTNFAALLIRDRASMVTNPPPREPTDDEKLLEEARKIIDQGRELAQATVDRAVESKRITLARKYLDVTDPVARPVELGP